MFTNNELTEIYITRQNELGYVSAGYNKSSLTPSSSNPIPSWVSLICLTALTHGNKWLVLFLIPSAIPLNYCLIGTMD